MLAACAAVIAIVLLGMGLAIVEIRRLTPLAFRCKECAAEFTRPPGQRFPRRCPRCRSTSWAG